MCNEKDLKLSIIKKMSSIVLKNSIRFSTFLTYKKEGEMKISLVIIERM